MSHSDKYIFLDRDGTIIHDVNYLKNISDIRFFDGTFRALKKFIDYIVSTLRTADLHVGR